MFLDPNQLQSASASDILQAILQGHLDIDGRVLRSLLDRRSETVQAMVAVASGNQREEALELAVDFALLFHALEAPEGIPFLIEVLRQEPEEIPDEVTEALHFFGKPALEALLELYETLDESASEEVAFLIASFHIRDERVFRLLLDRLEYSAAEGAFLLGVYGDPAAKHVLEDLRATLKPGDVELKKEIDEALQILSTQTEAKHEPTPVDIFSRYPDEAALPIDLLGEEERLELLHNESPVIRAEAAHSFFNQHPNGNAVKELLRVAQSDSDVTVRARAWEALADATEQTEVVEALLAVLRNQDAPVLERASALVGLSMEADRNEVRQAMEEMYDRHPEARAKALEAMWRSLHPAFRDRFAEHLTDEDLEVRRSAVWGVGYFAVKEALDRVRGLFDHEELRSDAIFAYALALPNDISKGRVKGLLKRIEKDAGGLSEMEERLAMTALDERLMLSGKEPVFFPED